MSGGAPTLRVPTEPRQQAITSQSGELIISWLAPFDTGGTALTGYVVTVDPGGIVRNLGPSILETNVTGLSNGTPYTVTITATNSVGNSPSVTAIASPSGPWILGGTGSLVGAPLGWGGNGGINNSRGAYAATAPPAGVTNGYQIGSTQCGVLPVLQAQGQSYANLTVISGSGPFVDATGQVSGTKTYDPVTGMTSISVTRNNAILEYLDMNGQIFVNARNVIIRYCRIDTRLVTKAGSYSIKTYVQHPGLILSYCEIICGQGVSAAVPPYGEYVARYCDVWNISNDAFKVGDNTLIEFNWVHDMLKAPSAHADAIQWTAGDNISVHHNRLEPYTGTADQEAYQIADPGNGATQVGKMTGNGTWFTFEDNYADGCTYILRAGNGSPDAKGWITEHAYWRRNRIGRKFVFGPLYNATQASADQIVEDTNVWHESGQTYHRQNTTWYYSQVVTEGQSIKTWTPSHNGVVQ
jgi:hypothetical protein